MDDREVKLEQKYFNKLCNMMRLNTPEHRNYHFLLEEMYETPFIFVHPLDENRVFDGLDLRVEIMRSDEEYLRRGANVLEVLAAFSRRIEENVLAEPGNDKIERMFWIMLSNLGLLRYDDFHFDESKVSKILSDWMNRRDKNLKIFPLKVTSSDGNEFDFWWQMQLYVEENY